MTNTLARVLIVHNTYQNRGGEDAVVEDEARLLGDQGHAVKIYFRNNNDVNGEPRLALAQQTLWSTRTVQEIAKLIGEFRPDVIHAHNTFPLISPSLYWAADHAGIPLVQTLHNFRLLCPQAMFLRDGRVCEDCLGHLPWRGAIRGCYRDSVMQTSVLAGMLALHRTIGTYARKISRFIVLTEFSRNKFIKGGLPKQKIAVKPNFVDMSPPKEGKSRDGFLFVGRLSPEKGIAILAAAMEQLPVASLTSIGVGPDGFRLADLTNVKDLGTQNQERVQAAMGRALCMVLPSLCYENFPRTLVEAFACGLPVIASRLGAFAELVEDFGTGLLFDPGNASDLATKLRWAIVHPEEMRIMGINARRQYEAKYTPEINYQQLVAVYREATNLVIEKAVL